LIFAGTSAAAAESAPTDAVDAVGFAAAADPELVLAGPFDAQPAVASATAASTLPTTMWAGFFTLGPPGRAPQHGE
jgi:hypothetical protein